MDINDFKYIFTDQNMFFTIMDKIAGAIWAFQNSVFIPVLILLPLAAIFDDRYCRQSLCPAVWPSVCPNNVTDLTL